eukprot:s237_g2.t1
MDVEHVRILYWKDWAVQQATRCADAAEGRSHLRGGRPQAVPVSSRPRSECLALLALMLLALGSLAAFAGRLAKGWRFSFLLPRGPCQAELLPTTQPQKSLQSTMDYPNVLLPSNKQDMRRQADSDSCSCPAPPNHVDVTSSREDIQQIAVSWMSDAAKQPW